MNDLPNETSVTFFVLLKTKSGLTKQGNAVRIPLRNNKI
ncbi:hypothetical protein M134_1466 [Bacteroides fragilis str. S24L34]|nr:hypothetical protein M134_1466 [Bacteroides fragilis str. S24L34]